QPVKEGTFAQRFPSKVARVSLAPGAESRVDIDIPRGPTVVVNPVLEGGGAAQYAIAALIRGEAHAATRGQLHDLLAGPHHHPPPRQHEGFEDVVPGAYTLCGLSLPDPSEPDEKKAARPVVCRALTVTSAPDHQEATLTLPPP